MSGQACSPRSALRSLRTTKHTFVVEPRGFEPRTSANFGVLSTNSGRGPFRSPIGRKPRRRRRSREAHTFLSDSSVRRFSLPERRTASTVVPHTARSGARPIAAKSSARSCDGWRRVQ